jgi:hypothetical protein
MFMDYSLIGSGLATSLCEDCAFLVELGTGVDFGKEMVDISLAVINEETGEIEWDDEAVWNHADYHLWISSPASCGKPCDLKCGILLMAGHLVMKINN